MTVEMFKLFLLFKSKTKFRLVQHLKLKKGANYTAQTETVGVM